MSQDSQLQQAILAELNWEPSVLAGHIGVTAKDGVATLSGHVESYPHKHAAEMAARRVKGVFAVADEIIVQLPPSTRPSDEDIAAAVIERLAWDVSIPQDCIKATVTEGWLTLTGQVNFHYQREAAAQDARNLRGVVGITNEMTIKPRVDVAHLSMEITHALNRSWFFDPDAIRVNAEGGVVRLSGTVHSPNDRLIAANTAWSASGVTAVENDIKVL
ncbi:MAG: ornithine aminotransferase [Rhodospirillales bacterium 20-60-12]|nr:MAG: ornithine aminotransferase [Rhodospirillales bacterium 20-60-12]